MGWEMENSIPGRYIVESWPILLWLPKPLQWFRHEQERTRALDAALYTRLLREVARKMERGAAQPCLSAHMLETVGETGELSELQMAYNVSSSFSAGVHTVAATFDVFLLAMLHHPACAARAQAELDAVVGAARLPTHADARALPYLCALVKEVQRWRPIAPTGVAHAVTEDDTYAGYFIPKGATVYANIYAIAKDPAAFPEPEAFRPERFLGAEGAEGAPFDLPFGFGRRACPGRDVALQSLLIVLARVLWAFDVRPAPPYVDPRTGRVDAGLPDADAFVGGLVSRPVPFGVRMVVRGEERRKVVEREAEAAEGELGAWE
ncbi:cytochrome P450 [Phellopilus nigrolimitatus]|nr:cytochrome P450 [Phellopilus nigrolimitatus]